MTATPIEDFLPVLSAGRHRNAKRGACFMEFASYLAGERWSDRPSCTHPSLAALARLVNDLSSDQARTKLTVHITSVIGLNGSDPRIPIVIASLAASSALPVASMARQRALATGLVRCERLLAAWDGPVIDRTRVRIRAAFLMAPGTEQWAIDFIDQISPRGTELPTINDEAVLRTSAIGIADACVPDTDERLGALLALAIEECSIILAPQVPQQAAFPVTVLT
jgi:hypothetical protein